MDRRRFLKGSLALGGAAIAGRLGSPRGGFGAAARSRIVIARDGRLRSASGSVESARLAALLDEAVCNLFGCDDPVEPWRRLFRPGEVVGLKVNCLAGRGMSTPVDLVEAVRERLRKAGIGKKEIVIWDRQNTDLEEGGFTISERGGDSRCYGNDLFGFEPELMTFGSAGSLVCKTLTRVCDAVVNLPVLKDHGITGVTLALKNMFGAIHNPNKYHTGAGDPFIADVNMFSPIREKSRLIVCDASTAQYEGGPPFKPEWTWPFNGLIAGIDPVAFDTVGRRILEEKRAAERLPSFRVAEREPTYIATAADEQHLLGTADEARIERIEVGA